jgi:hypothetical protein
LLLCFQGVWARTVSLTGDEDNMDARYDELLCERYRVIFRDRHGAMTATAMCWGFACGDGWYALIDTLCAEIQRHVDAAHVQPVVAVQVKEKFGALRFYTTGGDEYTRGLIWAADAMSAFICEKCGAPAVSSGNGWIVTHCAEHGGVAFPLDQLKYGDYKDEPDAFYLAKPERLAAWERARGFRLPPTRTPGWRHIACALEHTIKNDIRHNRMPCPIVAGSDESLGLRYQWRGSEDQGRFQGMFRLAEVYAARCDRRTGKPTE